jgi:hypothetical protein
MQGIPPSRHRASMRILICVFFSIGLIWADKAADRASIEKTIAAFNNPKAKPSDVWAPGVDGKGQRSGLVRGGPMSETIGGGINIVSINLTGPRTAVVSATQTQISSAGGWFTAHLSVELRRFRSGWRIVQLRPEEARLVPYGNSINP